MLILAGDIGGTKTVLQISQVSSSQVVPLATARYAASDYGGLIPILQEFLGDHDVPLAGATFGVAGPITTTASGVQQADLTNLAWHLDSAALAQACRLSRVALINDFAACAWGILGLNKNDTLTLQTGQYTATAPRLVIGAGTGLGVAQLIPCGTQFTILSSEGSHGDFAPTDELQIELLRYLWQQHSHLSYDRLVSGPGLEAMYRFFCQRAGQHAPQVLSAACITQSNDPLARATLELFLRLYGAVAGNLALHTLAYGGVYLAGGIAPKIIPHLQNGLWLSAFSAKGRMSSLMPKFPVHIVTHPNCGLLGAALHAYAALNSPA